MYSWCRRYDSSSMPMYSRPSRRSSGPEASNDALDDLADGAPRDAQHPRRRGPVHHLGEVGRLVLEVAREARAWLGPRHELGVDLAARAAVHATLPVPSVTSIPAKSRCRHVRGAVVVHARRSAHARRAVRAPESSARRRSRSPMSVNSKPVTRVCFNASWSPE